MYKRFVNVSHKWLDTGSVTISPRAYADYTTEYGAYIKM